MTAARKPRVPRGYRLVTRGRVHRGDRCIGKGSIHRDSFTGMGGCSIATLSRDCGCIIIRKVSRPAARVRDGKGRK